MPAFVRVKGVEPREGFIVDVQFTDGSQSEINLEPYLHGPVFEPLRQNISLFKQMHIEGGTIAWENGADIDPDVLYHGIAPAWSVSDSTN